MITRQNGLAAGPVRIAPTPSEEAERERERLRQELLRRIMDREVRRQAARGTPR